MGNTMREYKTNDDIYRFTQEIIELAIDHDDQETAQLLNDAIRVIFMISVKFGELITFRQMTTISKTSLEIING
jgi:hypothetical protein